MIEDVVPTKPALAVAQLEGVLEAMDRRAVDESGEGDDKEGRGGKSGGGKSGGQKFSTKLTGMDLISEVVQFFKNIPVSSHQLALNLLSKAKGFAGIADLNKVAQAMISLVSEPVKNPPNKPGGSDIGPR